MLPTQLNPTLWALSTACFNVMLVGCAHATDPGQPNVSNPNAARTNPITQSAVQPAQAIDLPQTAQTTNSFVLTNAPATMVATNTLAPSQAASIQEYKKEVAQHIYNRFKDKLHRGKLPPNIPAVGVIELQIDAQGNIIQTSWRRKPSVTEYAQLTEKILQEAAPFPAPAKLGKAEFLDVWLWTKESMFQLDSLTEGQR